MNFICSAWHIVKAADLTVHEKHWNLEGIKRYRCPECHSKTVWKITKLMTNEKRALLKNELIQLKLALHSIKKLNLETEAPYIKQLVDKAMLYAENELKKDLLLRINMALDDLAEAWRKTGFLSNNFELERPTYVEIALSKFKDW